MRPRTPIPLPESAWTVEGGFTVLAPGLTLPEEVRALVGGRAVRPRVHPDRRGPPKDGWTEMNGHRWAAFGFAMWREDCPPPLVDMDRRWKNEKTLRTPVSGDPVERFLLTEVRRPVGVPLALVGHCEAVVSRRVLPDIGALLGRPPRPPTPYESRDWRGGLELRRAGRTVLVAPTFAPWVRMDLDQGTDPESAIRVRYGGEVVAFMMPILARPYSSAATVNRLVAGALAAGENP